MYAVSRDDESAWFFDGLRAGEFRLPRRRGDGEFLDPRAASQIDEQVDYVPVSGLGRVVSWAVPASEEESPPVVVGIVELDEGPWWWGRLGDVDPGTDLIGHRVEVEFLTSGPSLDDEIVAVFRPAEAVEADD